MGLVLLFYLYFSFDSLSLPAYSHLSPTSSFNCLYRCKPRPETVASTSPTLRASPEHGDLGSPSSHPDSTAQQFTDSEGYQAPPLTASSNTGWPRKIRQCIPTKTEGALPLTLCTFRRDQTICNGPYEPLMYFPQAIPVSDTFVSSHSRYAPLLRARWLQKNHRFAT